MAKKKIVKERAMDLEVKCLECGHIFDFTETQLVELIYVKTPKYVCPECGSGRLTWNTDQE